MPDLSLRTVCALDWKVAMAVHSLLAAGIAETAQLSAWSAVVLAPADRTRQQELTGRGGKRWEAAKMLPATAAQTLKLLSRRARVKAEPAPPAEEATPGRPDLGDLRQRAAARLSGAHPSPAAANGGAPAPPAGCCNCTRRADSETLT